MSLILIIEDSQAMAEAAAEALKGAGYQTVTCLTASDAFSACQERRPDLVLTEFYLHEGTGLDFLEKLTRLDQAPPVIMATACGREETAARALALGAWAYVMKTEAWLSNLPGLAERCLGEWKLRQAAREKETLQRRLEAQNELAGWLAHNFKNILAASIGYLNLINLKNPDQDRGRQMEYLDDSRQSQESALNLLEQLIRMTETEGGEAERIVAAEVVDEAWDTVKSKVVHHLTGLEPDKAAEHEAKVGRVLFLNSARRLSPLNMVRSDLASIIEALLQNALEAVLDQAEPRILVVGEMKDRNKVSGRFSLNPAEPPEHRRRDGGAQSELDLELTVKDNGRGMSENVLKHALEPLFSTKGEVGVGMSLSLVSSLVIRHGGDLNLTSKPGSGTVVKIVFPL